MNNYNKLKNNFEEIGLLTFNQNIDKYIDLINQGQLTMVDALYMMTEKEKEFRQERVDKSMIKTAHFPFIKTFEDFDFSFQPSIVKEEILDLKNLIFLNSAENIILVGTPGVGKTHIATSIGIETSKNRYQTYFITAHELISQLKKAQLENTLMRRLKYFTSYSVLIIDEVGFLPISRDEANLFFQLINMRYEKHPTIITTNKSFNKWDEVLGDPVIANAILDRLLHHSKVFSIVGPSYRTKDKTKYFSEDE
ncbi:MAG TPA: hypothetical protein DEA28_00835 [Firmicutes bacterium]|nr:hypothetical protein [Bacillota bacterium]